MTPEALRSQPTNVRGDGDLGAVRAKCLSRPDVFSLRRHYKGTARFVQKYTLRAAHLELVGVDLYFTVEGMTFFCSIGLTWRSRSGSNGK